MSLFHGSQRKGVMRAVRARKRREANERIAHGHQHREQCFVSTSAHETLLRCGLPERAR